RRFFDSSQADFRLVDITSSQEVTSLVEEEGLFDITVCFELFEHIPPKTSGMLLENVKLLLRDGGLLFISTPNKDIYDIDTYTEGHVNELPCDRFLETLEGSGFRLLDVKGIMQKSATSSFLLREFGLAKRDGDRKTRPSKAQVLLRKAIVSVLDRRGLFAYFLNHISWKRYLEWKYRKAMNASPEQSSIVLVKACHDRKG
ncbi:MAG: class I SAM-dependent methyltransferase, partial [Thermoplasmata archaeon]